MNVYIITESAIIMTSRVSGKNLISLTDMINFFGAGIVLYIIFSNLTLCLW